MSNELKPCPFCGSDEVSLSNSQNLEGGISSYYIECHKCAGMGPEVSHTDCFALESNLKKVTKLWNTRPDSSLTAQNALIEKIKGFIGETSKCSPDLFKWGTILEIHKAITDFEKGQGE